MKTAILLVPALLLYGCGVEGLGTAATAAKLQAEQARQAKQNMEVVKEQLDAASKTAEQRARQAEEATRE